MYLEREPFPPGRAPSRRSCSNSMIDLDSLPMRLAVGQIDELTDEHMAFARQLGIDDIQMNTPRIPGESRWEYDHLSRLRERAENHGLRLICLENVPVQFY